MSRVAHARRQAVTSAALLLGIVFCVVVLAQRLRWRGDLTDEGLYSLSPALVTMIDGLEDRLAIRLYFNRDIEGAEQLLPARLTIQDRLREIAARGGEMVSVETVDPTVDFAAAQDAEHVGIEPVTITDARVGGVSVDQLYQGLELRYLDRSEVIPFVVPAEFEFAFASRLAALLAGRKRPVVGFFSREPLLPPPVPGVDQVAPPDRIFEEFRESLALRYAVRDLPELGVEQPVPEDLALLVVAQPRTVTADEQAALTAWLERGGRILLLHDHEHVVIQPGFGLDRTELTTGLDGWLARYGLTIHPHFVYDPECQPVPVDVELVEQPGGGVLRNPVFLPYGLFPIVRGSGLNTSHVVTSGLDQVELLWSHPVVFKTPEDLPLTADSLLRSSDRACALAADTTLSMERAEVQLLDLMAARKSEKQAFDLAVAVRGSFAPDAPEGVLVAVGDADLFRNLVLQGGSANAVFAQNLVDWLASDGALIELRTRGRQPRPLHDFYTAALEGAGGPGDDQAVARERDRAARAARDRMERWIAWANVLVPPLVILLAGLAHWAARRARARRPYVAGEGVA